MGKISKKFDTNSTSGEIFSISPVKNKPVEVSFTAPDLSSQGGLLLMNEYEKHHGFISKLSNCVSDTRYQPFVQHSYYEMFRQRICQIAAGYKDADDSDLLRDDSILKLCSGRLPDEKELSSQPTISRLENKLTDRELYKIGMKNNSLNLKNLFNGQTDNVMCISLYAQRVIVKIEVNDKGVNVRYIVTNVECACKREAA